MRLIPFAACLVACTDPRSLVVDITPGHETDAFRQDPAITAVHLHALDAGGGELLSASAAPGGSLQLGELPVDQLVRFEVSGEDGMGDVRLRGRSLSFVLDAVQSDIIGVFAQRLDQWSRPPGALPWGHKGGLAAAIGERYLLSVGGEGLGGEAAALSFYDLFALGGSPGGTLTFVPRSLAVSSDGSALLLVGDERALWLDFASGEAIEILEPPSGLGSFAAVAGGRTVDGPNASYIVGATRPDVPADRVLVIARDGTLSSARLLAERAGAAAVWIEGDGLLVAGGSVDAAGVEVLADGATEASALAFEPDATTGASASAHVVEGQAILVCGDAAGAAAAPRVLDLRCTSSCTPAPVAIDLEVVAGCHAHKSGPEVLLTGEGADGRMLSFALDPVTAEARPLPLREERYGGVVVPAPNGTLALVGGAYADGSPVLTVELFYPGP